MSEERRKLEELMDTEEEGPRFLLAVTFEEELLTRLGSYIRNLNLFKRNNEHLDRRMKELKFELNYNSAILADLTVALLGAFPLPERAPRILLDAQESYLRDLRKLESTESFIKNFYRLRNLGFPKSIREWEDFLIHLSALAALGGAEKKRFWECTKKE